MANPETCRDLLADMLAAASNMSDFDDMLDFHGYPVARIRAAIAADDAEREVVRRALNAARFAPHRHQPIDPEGVVKVSLLFAQRLEEWASEALKTGLMRQVDDARRVSGGDARAAAIAADDAERERVRRIEGAAQVVTDLPGVLLAVTIDIARASGTWRGVPWSIYAENDTRHDHVRGQVSVGQDTMADVAVYANGADSLWAEAQDVLAAILWSALRARAMRQLDAAQRIAGEMPELRRRHARAAVDGGRDDG